MMKRETAQTIFRTVVFAGAMLGTTACGGKKPAPAQPQNTAPVSTEPATPTDPSTDPATPGSDPCAGVDPCAGGERPRGTDPDGGGGAGRGFVLS